MARSNRRSARRLVWGAALVLAVTMGIAACGGDDDESQTDSTQADSTQTDSGAGDALEAFQAETTSGFEAALAEQTGSPPESGPTAVPDKTIVNIPCAQAAEGCARPARAVQQAAEEIGWKSILIDPAGDPSKAAEAVQRAIAIDADGITIQAWDAAVLAQPLEEAKDAGIKIVAFASTNEGDLYDVVVPPVDTFADDGFVLGQAIYEIADGDVKMLRMDGDEFGVVRGRTEGTVAFMEECAAAGGECETLANDNYLGSELQTRVPEQAVAIVRNNPEFNVLWAGYDAGLNFMIQGLDQAGLTDQGFAAGFDANVANLDIIREDGYEKVTVGLPMQWIGYGMVDNLNRMFQDEEPVDEGIKSKLLTESNVPASGAWDGDTDVRPAYREIWGL